MRTRNGFTRHVPRSRAAAWRVFAAAGAALLLAAVSVPSGPASPRNAATPAAERAPAPRRSDAGYLVPVRPDHTVAPWRPLKEGRSWTGLELGQSHDPALRLRVLRMALDAADRVAPGRALQLIADWLDLDELRRWCWLFERGHAGWRTVEFCMRNHAAGRLDHAHDARSHWAIHDGLVAGFTLGPTGFTEYTQSVSGQVYYVDPAGSDSNNGTSTGTPFQSPYLGRDAWSSGADDYVLLKRGGTWDHNLVTYPQIGDIGNKHGTSRAQPALFGAYGTGARPKLDLTAQAPSGANVRLGSKWIHFQSLEICDSTYDGGTTGQGQIDGVAFTDGAVGCQVENCYLHGITFGISAVQGSGGTDDLTFRRNVIRDCYSTTQDQQGAGIFAQGIPTALDVSENTLVHNGWTETAVTHAGTARAVTSTTIQLATSASSLDDAYNGAVVASGGKSGRVTYYVGSTRTCTIASWTGGTPSVTTYTVTGSHRRQYCHNTYVTDTCQGYSCYRNISVQAANHGLGRRNGQLYHNVVEECPTGIVADADPGHPDGAAQDVYENAVVGCSDPHLHDWHGQGATIGIESISADSMSSMRGNCVSGKAVADVNVACTGISIGTGTAWTVTGNCVYDVYNSATGNTRCIKFRPTQTASHTCTGNYLWQPNDGWLIETETAGGSPTYTFNNFYFADSQSNAFDIVGTGQRSWTQWQSDFSDSGVFSTGAAGSFSVPGRTLADYESSVMGGSGTLAAAIARLVAFDVDTWTEAEHGALPRLNFIRVGYGLDPVALAYTDGSAPALQSATWPDIGTSDHAHRTGVVLVTEFDVEATPDDVNAPTFNVPGRGIFDAEMVYKSGAGTTTIEWWVKDAANRVLAGDEVYVTITDGVVSNGGVGNAESVGVPTTNESTADGRAPSWRRGPGLAMPVHIDFVGKLSGSTAPRAGRVPIYDFHAGELDTLEHFQAAVAAKIPEGASGIASLDGEALYATALTGSYEDYDNNPDWPDNRDLLIAELMYLKEARPNVLRGLYQPVNHYSGIVGPDHVAERQLRVDLARRSYGLVDVFAHVDVLQPEAYPRDLGEFGPDEWAEFMRETVEACRLTNRHVLPARERPILVFLYANNPDEPYTPVQDWRRLADNIAAARAAGADGVILAGSETILPDDYETTVLRPALAAAGCYMARGTRRVGRAVRTGRRL